MTAIQFAHPSQNAASPATAARTGDVLRLPELAGKAMWRGSELGSSAQREVIATGFDALDAELPGGGWPCRSLTEILQPQPSLCEWRLLGGSLHRIVASGGQIVLISPPKYPHLPGLMQHGLHQNQISPRAIMRFASVPVQAGNGAVRCISRAAALACGSCCRLAARRSGFQAPWPCA